MAPIRLVSYLEDERPIAGLALGERVYAIEQAGSVVSIQALLDRWDWALPHLLRMAEAPLSAGRRLDEVTLLAPLHRPTAIYCAGANYRDHAMAMSRIQNLPPPPDPRDIGLGPWHFMKTGHSVIGPGASVQCRSQRLDWEAELAVVIGARGKGIPVKHALEYVAGYTIANDLSARDRIQRAGISDHSPFKYDWVAHKNFDGACPLGPWIVVASEIPDPQTLSIKLWVNDTIRQDSNSSNMIFSVAEQIAALSNCITLHPGDVILTGTPAGTGMESGHWLKPGDQVRIDVELLGTLTNLIIE